jgi:hypothetical protein
VVVDTFAAVLVVAAIVVVLTGRVVDVAAVVAGEATDASVSAPAAHEATVIKINAEPTSRGTDRLPPTICGDTIHVPLVVDEPGRDTSRNLILAI